MEFTDRNCQEFMEQLPEAVFLETLEGDILDVNKEACELLGYSKEELINLDVEDLEPEDAPIFLPDQVDEATRSGEPLKTTKIKKDGTEVPVELKGKILEIEGQKRVLVTVRDISERVEANEELRRNKERYQSYFEELGDAVFITKAGGEDHSRILDANTAAEDQTGYSEEELIGMNLLENITAGEPLEMDYEEADQKLSQGETISYTEKKRRKGGTEYWTEVVVTPIEHEGERANLSINRDITERMQVKDRLEQYKMAVQGSDDLIATCDEDYNYIFANPAYRSYYEVGEKEIRNYKLGDLISDPAFENEVKPRVDRCLQGERIDYEMERTHPTKGPRQLRIMYYPLKSEEGIHGVVAVMRDVTEVKEIEKQLEETNERLRQSRERYKRYFDELGDAVFITKVGEEDHGSILDANSAAEDQTGYPLNELIGMNIADDFTVGRPEELSYEEIDDKLSKGETVSFTEKKRRKDGNIYWTEVMVTLIEHEGDPATLSINRDITERKRTEQKLKQSQERLQLALEGTEAGIWDWNFQTGEVVFNEKWAEIIGYTLEELHPVTMETWEELAHPEDLKRSEELLEKHVDGETEVYECEVRVKHKNGDWIWVLTRGRVVDWDEQGEPIRMVGTHQVITERKKVEQELNEERDKLRHLHDAVDQLQQQNDEESILQTAVEVSESILDFELCAIDLIEGEYLETKAISSGLSIDQTSKYKIGEGIGGLTAERGETIWEDDLREHPEAKPTNKEFRAIISVPIGEVGVFQVVSKEVGSFDKEDVELAEILSNHLREEISRVRLEEDLRQQAIHDPLTGLYNRRHFNITLDKEVERCARYGHNLAFIMIDVNRFKEINDRYSHQTGDEVLQEVAELLQANVRDADTVVRYGGDEFLIMMPETNGEADTTVKRLRNKIKEWNDESDLLDFPLTLAMGISHWSPEEDIDVEAALKKSDINMYGDKG
ncbi:PAS domain S-box protein [Candidatus Bipolaricaulota bacterium]|nr:PAS domain S-box protein [Candidatus Bipolaricaulota bacterium]